MVKKFMCMCDSGASFLQVHNRPIKTLKSLYKNQPPELGTKSLFRYSLPLFLTRYHYRYALITMMFCKVQVMMQRGTNWV